MAKGKGTFLVGQGNLLLLVGGASLIVGGTGLYVLGVQSFLPIALLMTGGVCGLMGLYGVLTSQFGAGRAPERLSDSTEASPFQSPTWWARFKRSRGVPAIEAAALAATRAARGDLGGALDEARARLGGGAGGGDGEGARAMRFLVVDDEYSDRKVIRSMLLEAYEGAVVVQAENGSHAVNELAKGRFDVVISGINMPHMDGLELLTIVKTQYPRAHVILVSAVAHLKRGEAMRAGAAECLVKPANKHVLVTAIRKCLRTQDGGAERRRRA